VTTAQIITNVFPASLNAEQKDRKPPSLLAPSLSYLRAIVSDYSSHGLVCVPAIDKIPAVNVKPWEIEPPSEIEREAMFCEDGLNIAIICGAPSANLFQIDAETARAFDQQYELCHRAGIRNTWIDRTPSQGGHFWFTLPFPVKTRGKRNDVEVLAQGRITIAPPSIAYSKVDGTRQPYRFAQRTDKILALESLDQVPWLNLEKVSTHLPWRAYPRKAQRLLQGEYDRDRYETRSEVEQAIVSCLVNAGLAWDSILTAFRNNPAAGKFASLEHSDPQHAIDYLRHSYNRARTWCADQSPARRNALELLNYAHSIPWRGRRGSSLRACFIAHCGLSYQSGGPTYHASVRDIAEFAACDKNTAGRATEDLCRAGAVNLVQRSAYVFARRFSLPDSRELVKRGIFQTLTTKQCEGVYASYLFLVPEPFRRGGLGKAAYEGLCAFRAGPLTAQQIAEKTGRSLKTVRIALKRLKVHSLTVKSGKVWLGRSLESIDMDALTKAVCMRGAAKAQKERHNAERLRRKVRNKVRQHEQREHGDA
jgi:hypothetical protein